MSHRDETMMALGRLGFRYIDARELVGAAKALHKWAKNECNGAIQRDENGRPYWHSTVDGRQLAPTADRKASARRRATEIAARYCLRAYFQTDPRGCPLYLLRPGDVPDGSDASCCYTNFVAVMP